MNYAGKFDVKLPAEGPGSGSPHSGGQAHVTQVSSPHAPSDALIVPDAHLLFTGDFKRSGVDLILSNGENEYVLHDYFKGEKRAALASPDGAHLTGALVNALTGHVDYSQADGNASAGKIIGHVTKLAGAATATRNGVSVILNVGDNVEKGDVVQAGSDSTLGLTFIDGTVFGLSSNARMVLNEMVYDPNGSSNSSLLSLVAGTITFVAGETAKHGDMKVDTPVATMGIRGTAVLVEIDFDIPVPQPNAGGAPLPNAKFQVLVEPDGTTGSYILFDKATLTPIATVNQAGQQINISQGTVSITNAPLPPDVQKLITDVFSLKFTDTNPKTFDHFTDIGVPQALEPIVLANGATAIPLVVNVNTPPAAEASSSNTPTDPQHHIPGPPKVVAFSAALVERADTTGSSALDATSNRIAFEDVNIADRPTVSTHFGSFKYEDAQHNDITAALSAQQLADIAALEVNLGLVPDPGNRNTGSANWTYNIADHAFDFLAAGETLTLTYIAQVDNNFPPNNETGVEEFTITITGANDTPSLAADSAASHAIIELPGQTGDTGDQDTASGTLTFTDVDLTDTHSTSSGVSTITWSGGATLPSGLEAVLANAFSASIVTDSQGTGSGSIGFDFSASDTNFDFLAAGETLTVVYEVTVTDQHGASSTKPVTITITGTNDGPSLDVDSSGSHAIVERADETSDSGDQDTASGTLAFTDVDLTDTHSTSSGLSTITWSGGATLPSGLEAVLASAFSASIVTDSQGTGSGSIGFDFSASDVNFDFLAAGETLTVVYEVTVTDEHGASSTKPVTITITGTNDGPVLDVGATPVLDAEDEGVGAPVNGTAVGTLVSSLVNLSSPQGCLDNISDADHGALAGIALTGTDTSQGTWFYSIDGGAQWTAVGSVSNSSALLLAADADTRLYFAPSAGYSGTDINAITFRAWDQSVGSNGASGIDTTVDGGSSAFSNASDTANITINATDAAPVVDLNGTMDGSDNIASYSRDSALPIQIAQDATITDVDSPNLVSMTVTLTDPQDNSSGDGGINIKELLSLNEGAATLVDEYGLILSFAPVIYSEDPFQLTITGSASVDVYQSILQGIQYADTKTGSQDIAARSVTVVVNDGTLDSDVQNVTIEVAAPAGAAGEPINLALADPSPDHLGPLTLTISGMPSAWFLSEGSHNRDGTWTVQTNDVAALFVTSSATYTGALILEVAMEWTKVDGSIGHATISDNVEVYAKGSPIFAWSGDDSLTASSANDLLVFSQPIGHDTVYSFDSSADKIDLVGFAGFTGFADIQAHLSENADGNAVIKISDGQSITLHGVHAGSLTASNFVFDQAPTLANTGTMTIDDGALLPVTGVVDNNGTIILSSTGDQTDLQIIQTGLTLDGGGRIVLSDSDANVIAGTSSSVTLDNVDNTISGAGQLGGGELSLINGGTINATGAHSLTIDTGSNPIVNSGVLEASGTGGLMVESAIENSGLLWANGANLTVQGQVSGNGTAAIDGGGTLDFEASSTANVAFGAATGGTLKLGDSFHFNGTITGFAGSDVIDLANVQFEGASIGYNENAAGDGGTLTISTGAQTVELSLLGHYTADNFNLVSDQLKGTLVSYVPHDLVV